MVENEREDNKIRFRHFIPSNLLPWKYYYHYSYCYYFTRVTLPHYYYHHLLPLLLVLLMVTSTAIVTTTTITCTPLFLLFFKVGEIPGLWGDRTTAEFCRARTYGASFDFPPESPFRSTSKNQSWPKIIVNNTGQSANTVPIRSCRDVPG